MKVFLLKRSYFTFQEKESYRLDLLGKEMIELMSQRLDAVICDENDDQIKNLQEGVVLFSCYPFLSRVALFSFVHAHEGGFAFEGGYVVRKGEQENSLPFIPSGFALGQGVFSLADYKFYKRVAREERISQLLNQGVLVDDGAEIDYDSQIEKGAIIGKNVKIVGRCTIGKNVTIGDSSYLENCEVGEGTCVKSSMLLQAKIGSNCTVGPFAYIRPNTVIGNGCRIGDFVEVKNSHIGDRCKISHLSYVGDADLGENINVGCGVVFVNYNGRIKQRTKVGNGCFLGSNCNLIAPITLGEGVFVAAGTTLTKNLNDDDFCIGRSRESIKKGYSKKYLPKK